MFKLVCVACRPTTDCFYYDVWTVRRLQIAINVNDIAKLYTVMLSVGPTGCREMSLLNIAIL